MQEHWVKEEIRYVTKIVELDDQVFSLKTTLEKSEAERLQLSKTAAASTGKETDKTTSSGSKDDDSQENLSQLVEELQKALEKSQSRHTAIKAQLDTVVALAQRRKAETIKWVEYADSLEKKIKSLEKKKTAAKQSTPMPQDQTSTRTLTPTPATVPPPPPPSSNISTRAIYNMLEKQTEPEPQPQVEVSKPTLSASFSSTDGSYFLGNPAADDYEPAELAEPELPPQKITRTSSAGRTDNEAVLDSTQGDPSSDGPEPDLPALPTPRATNSDGVSGRVTIKSEPSSDGPEIIWERATKKPKRDEKSGSEGSKTYPQTPRILPTVKRESSDNTQRVQGLAHYRESQESIDLDEGQLTVQTPRKRHIFYQQMLVERLSDESSLGASQEKPTDEQPSTKTAMAAPLPPRLFPLPPPPTPATPSTPLATISGNVRRGVKDMTKSMKHLKRGIESLTEDNQPYSSPSGVSKRTSMDPPGTTKPTRLGSLLNSRPAEPSPLSSLPRPAPSAAPPRYHGAADSPIAGLFGRPPPTRVLPHLRDDDNTSLPRTPSAPAASRNVHTPAAAVLSTPTTNPLTAALLAAKAESAAKKASSPLRARPVERLKVDDFKINPAFNNGETFAYNEVVRGRTDRAGLSGCTDPQCCGKAFRGMATSELDAAGPTHLRRSESIVSMERHLGDGAYMLAQMSPEEKKELWLEARTKELADKYGKHRHRYHRRASPPGFWDTDFPTTQDEEHNRAEAEKVERITVQERYREAMRSGGGRWLFRDE
ncbi:hypothetical protein Sste5346_001187 [Sporothrix stenoceras]|uniref:DNA endonuclease activator Ctp1 C-terminal domain-containing protein n=1 Tax=Sporothrix stenoceras TaxID=5173 RepID=A0ABR3ZRC4_9PEZI